MLRRNRYKTKQKRLNRKGQNTIEYVIVVAVVIAAILAFLGPSGPFRSALNTTLNTATGTMEMMSSRYQNSIY